MKKSRPWSCRLSRPRRQNPTDLKAIQKGELEDKRIHTSSQRTAKGAALSDRSRNKTSQNVRVRRLREKSLRRAAGMRPASILQAADSCARKLPCQPAERSHQSRR